MTTTTPTSKRTWRFTARAHSLAWGLLWTLVTLAIVAFGAWADLSGAFL